LKDYEGIFITKANVTDEISQKTLTQIEGEITKNGGKVENVEKWGKRNLAYSINKNKEGFYYKLDFKIQPDKISEVKKGCKLNEDIIRAAIIKK